VKDHHYTHILWHVKDVYGENNGRNGALEINFFSMTTFLPILLGVCICVNFIIVYHNPYSRSSHVSLIQPPEHTNMSVLMEKLKITHTEPSIFWDVMPCSLAPTHRTAQCHNPEVSALCSHHCENLKQPWS